MENNIEALIGSAFIKKKGHNDKDKETLFQIEDCTLEEIKDSSFIGLLFSAGYCPPCKTFLTILKEFYNEVNIDKKKCEILYVPFDKSETEFQESYSQMPWTSLPYRDPRI